MTPENLAEEEREMSLIKKLWAGDKDAQSDLLNMLKETGLMDSEPKIKLNKSQKGAIRKLVNLLGAIHNYKGA